MALNAATATALGSGAPRVGVFLRLETDPVLRLWLGVGDCRAGIDATDGTGEIYVGYGELVAVPAFQQLVNGAADRAQFSISGISQRLAQTASSEASDVKNKFLRVGVGAFDGQWQLVAAPQWLRTFVCDYLTVSRDQTSGEPTWTIAVQVRSLLTGRRRPGLSFWTGDDQDRRSPGDTFCERAVLYSQEVQKAWPIL